MERWKDERTAMEVDTRDGEIFERKEKWNWKGRIGEEVGRTKEAELGRIG